jgi:tetratricopeptide (TPR) repeat protein
MRADSLAAQATQADSTWLRPAVARAVIARRLAQLHVSEPIEADAFLAQGIAHAESVLLRERNAEASEARGMLRYIRWALNLEADPTAADALLVDAEKDLQSAVQIDPARAEAWYALSIIHAQNARPVEAKIAALRAYEEDAYLRAASEVLWALYGTSYDLEQFADAVKFCREGRRRFPVDARFAECELWLLASPALRADVAEAWSFYDRYVGLTAENRKPYARARGGLLVGGVLARAAMTDSADAVLQRHRAEPAVDPSRELVSIEAIFRVMLGQHDEAVRLLKVFLTANPEHRDHWQDSAHWWWRALRDDPEFRVLIGASR